MLKSSFLSFAQVERLASLMHPANDPRKAYRSDALQNINAINTNPSGTSSQASQ